MAILSGMALILTRDQGSMMAFACFATEALLGKSDTEGDNFESMRAKAVDFLTVIVIGLTCVLLHTKRKPTSHRGHRSQPRAIF